MTFNEATTLVNSALDQLVQNDSQLLDLKICERALHFKIAHYMAQSQIIQPPLTLDCEYNRHLGNEKLLQLPGRQRPSNVFPDILVHERNSDDSNMLVLEIKRPGQSLDHDQNKLMAFVEQLHYRYAGHIIIGHNRRGVLIREVRWLNG
jgi:hypothetical protein